jgi:hypothetical protein
MPSLDRISQVIRRIIRSEFPDYVYRGIYEYAIQSVDGTTISADPVDTTLTLPHIAGLVLRSSILGETIVPTIGNRCLVMFVDGKPSRPVIVGCDPNNVEVAFDASSSITIGATCPSIDLGPSPEPLALATPVESMATALETFGTSLAAAAASPAYTGFAAAAAAASTNLESAISALASTIPTTVVKGT